MLWKLSSKETISMTHQTLFAGEKYKNIINLSSAELAQRVEKVNAYMYRSSLSCTQPDQGLCCFITQDKIF